ncbi:hypothetical protein FQA39_LY17263 [Lamprigera yunnana]|nr:hypothetical protein FQA39_LY17263 [Lamprigera yunnana]
MLYLMRYLDNELELQYEVASRGCSSKHSVAELQKSLRNILKLDRDTSFGTVEHDCALATDIEAITAGAKLLGSAIEEFNGDVSTSTFQRISTLFCYLFGQGEQMKTTNIEERAKQRLCLLTLTNLQSERNAKIKLFWRSFSIVSPLRALVGSSPAQPTTDADDLLFDIDSETEITPTTEAAYAEDDETDSENEDSDSENDDECGNEEISI